MKKILTLMVLASVMAFTNIDAFAQGEATAEFLMIAPGARAGGIGESNVALANDAYSTYWNPAGLAFVKNKRFSGMHANWLPQFNLGDMFYDFASYVHHRENLGTFGINATYLSLGEQIYMDEDQNNLGTFDSYNVALGLSYGTEISENISVGTTVKFIYMKLTDVPVGVQQTDGTGSVLAADIGMIWKPNFSKNTTFGFNLMNLGPKVTFVDADQADPIPTNLKMGIAYKALDQEFNKLTFTLDINKLLVKKYAADSVLVDGAWEKLEEKRPDPFYKAIFTSWADGGISTLPERMTYSGGLEYWYSNLFSLRAGYFWEHEDRGKRKFATFGAGIRYDMYQFDFSYLMTTGDSQHPLSDTMRFSLSFDIN